MSKPNPSLCKRHLSAVRVLGYELTLGMQPERMPTLSVVWEARLSPTERAALLSAALGCNEPDTVSAFAESYLAGPHIAPIPALDDLLDEAIHFADLASKAEHSAYATACFAALPHHEQQQFLMAARGAA